MNDKLGILELNQSSGSFHPITTTLKEISLLLQDLGFTQASGPEIESEKFNFDMLNIKEKSWINNYHKEVFNNLRKFMNAKELLKLKSYCSNI